MIGGVAIVAVCTIVGARAVAAGEDTVDVWRVTRDLAPGATPTTADLERVAVPPEAAAAYVAAADVPAGRLVRAAHAGEFLPVTALAEEAGSVDVRWVTVPVEPLHAPPDLAPGERVDVWASTGDALSDAPAPTLVLASALVSAVSADAVGFGGEYGVTLEIRPEDAAAVLAAVRSGAVDLVRVPADAAAVADAPGAATPLDNAPTAPADPTADPSADPTEGVES
ncbi:MAG: hypothetical protein ACKOTZ_13030 [Chloroflexota bacterium]